jgi:DNA-binding NtrC family response regulator
VGKEKAMGNNKKAILIIDDDVSISRAFSRILERNGYATDTAETGKEAIKKAQTKVYAAALIDVCLPDVNGNNLMNKLPQHNGRMVKIVISGFPMMAPKTEADAYLVKPVKPEEIILLLKEKLENYAVL